MRIKQGNFLSSLSRPVTAIFIFSNMYNKAIAVIINGGFYFQMHICFFPFGFYVLLLFLFQCLEQPLVKWWMLYLVYKVCKFNGSLSFNHPRKSCVNFLFVLVLFTSHICSYKDRISILFLKKMGFFPISHPTSLALSHVLRECL